MKTIAITLGDLKGDGVREVIKDVINLGDAVIKLKALHPTATLADITNVEYLEDTGVYIARHYSEVDIDRQVRGAKINRLTENLLLYKGIHDIQSNDQLTEYDDRKIWAN